MTRDNHVGEEAGPVLLSLRFPLAFDFQTKLRCFQSKNFASALLNRSKKRKRPLKLTIC